jgi:hypothetical protein
MMAWLTKLFRRPDAATALQYLREQRSVAERETARIRATGNFVVDMIEPSRPRNVRPPRPDRRSP